MGMKQKDYLEKSRFHQLLFLFRFGVFDGELVPLLELLAPSGDTVKRRLYSAGVSTFLPYFHIPR